MAPGTFRSSSWPYHDNHAADDINVKYKWWTLKNFIISQIQKFPDGDNDADANLRKKADR